MKRDTITLGNNGWYLDMTSTDESAWANSVSTVCAKTSTGVCVGESVVATILTALMALGNTGATDSQTGSDVTSHTIGYTNGTQSSVVGSDGTTTIAAPTTTTTSAHVNLLSKILSDVKAVPTEIADSFENAGLKLLGVYNLTNAAKTISQIHNTTKTVEDDIKSKISQAVGNVESRAEAAKSRVDAIKTKIQSAVKNEVSHVESDTKTVASHVANDVESTIDTVLHFNSSLGQHLVTAIGDTNLTELADLISKAIPGVPSFENITEDVESTVVNIADKVKDAAKNSVSELQSAISNLESKISSDKDNIQGAIDNVKTVTESVAKKVESAAQNTTKNAINWISYNIKNTDTDIADVISQLPTFNVTKFSSEISNFVDNLGDFKFCLSPSTGYNVSYTSPSTIFGEVYFNTYGGVESQCQ